MTGTDTCFTAAYFKLYMKANQRVGKTHAGRVRKPLSLRALIAPSAWQTPAHHRHANCSGDPGTRVQDSLLLAADPQRQAGWHFHHLYQPSNQVPIHSLSHRLLFRQTPAVKVISFSSTNKALLSRIQGQECLLLYWETEDSERAISRKKRGLERA